MEKGARGGCVYDWAWGTLLERERKSDDKAEVKLLDTKKPTKNFLTQEAFLSFHGT